MMHVGVDVGGTNISVGVVNKKYEIISRCSCKTKPPRKGIDLSYDISNLVKESLQSVSLSLQDVPYIGIGCPGAVNRETGVVEYSSNLFLKHWRIVDQVQRILRKRVVIENDANTAAYGEYLAGAAKGFKNTVTITLGTGVGGGIIIDNKIYSGTNYAGAEIGHMVINYKGRKCTCSRRGCFEAYASATGLIKTTKNFMKSYKKDETILWSIANDDIRNVSGRTAFEAAKRNDEVGKMIVDVYISQLACGVTNVINIFQPDVLCIGGGLSNEDDRFLLYPLIRAVKNERYSRHSVRQTRIVKAKLGNDAGIIGAAMLNESRRSEFNRSKGTTSAAVIKR